MSATEGIDWRAARERLERIRRAIESGARSDEQLDALYRARAALLSKPAGADAIAPGESIMIFRLGTARYGIPLADVAEVAARPRMAPAPGAPPEIAGLMQIRGEIRVVWNTARALHLPKADVGETASVLLLRTGAGEAGILVDEVEDIRHVQEDERRPAPEKSPHAAWMTGDLVIVLNAGALIPGSRDRTEENAEKSI